MPYMPVADIDICVLATAMVLLGLTCGNAKRRASFDISCYKAKGAASLAIIRLAIALK